MTRRAGGFLVGADQREVGRLVIELSPLPGFGGVTVRAARPHRALVDVIVAVTVHAVARCIAARLVGGVAGRAVEPAVRALQDEIRAVVGERFGVEAADVGIATAVVRVAAPTRARALSTDAAVQTGASGEVEPDRLVADEAQVVLGPGVERTVAVPAVGFEIGVGVDQGTRHEEALQTGRPAVTRHQGEGEAEGEDAPPRDPRRPSDPM
jgi:hypothetical protein